MIPFYGINILKGKTRMIKSDFGLISDHFHAVTTFWLPRSFSVYTLTLHSMLHSLNPIHHHSMHICMRLKYNKNIVYYLVQHTDVHCTHQWRGQLTNTNTSEMLSSLLFLNSLLTSCDCCESFLVYNDQQFPELVGFKASLIKRMPPLFLNVRRLPHVSAGER